jgi:hypothetical protein
MSYYDDNFGHYAGENAGEAYRYFSRQSVSKVCKGCGYKVRILPHYAYCNSCAETMERGGEMPEYYHSEEAQKPERRELPLTPAEAKAVAAWKMERAVHRKAAKEMRDSAKAWNLAQTATPVKRPVRRRPKAQD